MNFLTVEGNLGKDPESKQCNDKTRVTFSMAIARYGKEEKFWAYVTAWGKTAEMAKSLKKGDWVRVLGALDGYEKEGKWNLLINATVLRKQSGIEKKKEEAPADNDFDIPF